MARLALRISSRQLTVSLYLVSALFGKKSSIACSDFFGWRFVSLATRLILTPGFGLADSLTLVVIRTTELAVGKLPASLSRSTALSTNT
jgi:hypothetical protein